MTTTLVRGIAELLTNDPSLGEGTVGRRRDAAMVVDDERVLWVGDDRLAPDADEVLDLEGRAVIPGFVDSHTHLVFAGERSAEFEARLSGQRYDGGGIERTVAATRAASTAELLTLARRRVTALRASGVTTIESKSGYALDVEGEARLCELSAELADEATFLGAHVVPAEYARRRDEYVELVAGEMLNACAPYVRWADVFCDRGAFSVDEARHVLEAARDRGLGLRLHANQIDDIGAIALALELGAASVDHCSHVSDDDVAALGASATVVTLLPGAEFSTRGVYPSGRRFIDAGATVALSTDCNPGTSYVTSMPFVVALAVREMDLLVDEAIVAATLGGARALRRDDVGHLGIGARCDFVVIDGPRVAHLAYRPGGDVIAQVWRGERSVNR